MKKEDLSNNVAKGSILPKTLNDQIKQTKKITGKKNVSIKIVQPKLTIKGNFELNEKDKKQKRAATMRAKKSMVVPSIGRTRVQSRGQSSIQHEAAEDDDFEVEDEEIEQDSRQQLLDQSGDRNMGEGLQQDYLPDN